MAITSFETVPLTLNAARAIGLSTLVAPTVTVTQEFSATVGLIYPKRSN